MKKALDFIIKSMNGMAYGLFSTLIIGTIISIHHFHSIIWTTYNCTTYIFGTIVYSIFSIWDSEKVILLKRSVSGFICAICKLGKSYKNIFFIKHWYSTYFYYLCRWMIVIKKAIRIITFPAKMIMDLSRFVLLYQDISVSLTFAIIL